MMQLNPFGLEVLAVVDHTYAEGTIIIMIEIVTTAISEAYPLFPIIFY
jgi:hypothetical protein